MPDEGKMKMATAENLRTLREREDLTQTQLAEIVGSTRAAVSRWESGEVQPRAKYLGALADRFNLQMDDLVSEDHGLAAQSRGDVRRPMPSPTVAPLIGAIAAGEPIEAVQQQAEQAWVDPEVQARYPDGFYLVVHGDSMNRVLPDGAFAYINPCDFARNGVIMAVNVNGDDATIKRVFTAGESLVLKPESTNPKHRDRLIDSTDPDAPRVRIVGEVVWYYVPFGQKL